MLTIEIRDKAVLAALSALQDRTKNLQPVMDDIGQALVSRIQQAMSRGVDPWGGAHQPLSSKTINTRFRGGKRIGKSGKMTAKYSRHMTGNHIPLLDTRQHIYNRITHKADASSVAIGINDSANARIGAIHQFGGKAGRGHGAIIPPRPFLPIRNDQVDLPESWAKEVKSIVRKALSEK